MTVYDTAGIERHMSTIPQTYFRWSKVIMLVYSIDDSDTFDSLTNWADNAISARAGRAQSEIVTVLVGNKVDLDDERKVSKTRAQQVSKPVSNCSRDRCGSLLPGRVQLPTDESHRNRNKGRKAPLGCLVYCWADSQVFQTRKGVHV